MDFNLIKPFANNDNIRNWRNTVDLFKIYAQMCTPTMLMKLSETYKECAAWMKQWLPNGDLYWCCKFCHEEIIQHKLVHYVTNNHIYVIVYNFDKIFYNLSQQKQLRIMCSDCQRFLDDGNFDVFIKINRAAIYFNENTSPLNLNVNK